MDKLHQVVSVSALDDTRVRVVFDNGVEGVFDCSPYMKNKFWSRLSSPAFFRLVRAECGTLVWPDDIDIDPEEIWEGCVKGGSNAGSAPAPLSAGFTAAEPPARYDADRT